MNEKKLDGGSPAFPCPRYVNAGGETISLSDKPGESGMPLRAWLAGKALGGLCANPAEDVVEASPGLIAKWAVEQADALLAALKELP